MERKVRRYKSVPISSVLGKSIVRDMEVESKLTGELQLLYEDIKLTDFEIKSRTEVVRRYQNLFESKIKCNVESYGSYKTKTMVNKSDIDLTLIIKGDNGELDYTREFANYVLQQVRDVLIQGNYGNKRVLFLKNARIPIIKFVDGLSNYNVDISVNKTDAVQTAKFMVEKIKEFPGLEEMVILLKYYMKQRGLSDASNGGLCGYAQFLMVLNFIQIHPLIQNKNISIYENLGPLFMDFFLLYGIDFPYERSKISVKDKKYKINTIHKIFIEDPVNDGKNVTSACNSIGFIKSVFTQSYKLMLSAFAERIPQSKCLLDIWMEIPNNASLRPKKQR